MSVPALLGVFFGKNGMVEKLLPTDSLLGVRLEKSANQLPDFLTKMSLLLEIQVLPRFLDGLLFELANRE